MVAKSIVFSVKKNARENPRKSKLMCLHSAKLKLRGSDVPIGTNAHARRYGVDESIVVMFIISSVYHSSSRTFQLFTSFVP